MIEQKTLKKSEDHLQFILHLPLRVSDFFQVKKFRNVSLLSEIITLHKILTT